MLQSCTMPYLPKSPQLVQHISTQHSSQGHRDRATRLVSHSEAPCLMPVPGRWCPAVTVGGKDTLPAIPTVQHMVSNAATATKPDILHAAVEATQLSQRADSTKRANRSNCRGNRHTHQMRFLVQSNWIEWVSRRHSLYTWSSILDHNVQPSHALCSTAHSHMTHFNNRCRCYTIGIVDGKTRLCTGFSQDATQL